MTAHQKPRSVDEGAGSINGAYINAIGEDAPLGKAEG